MRNIWKCEILTLFFNFSCRIKKLIDFLIVFSARNFFIRNDVSVVKKIFPPFQSRPVFGPTWFPNIGFCGDFFTHLWISLTEKFQSKSDPSRKSSRKNRLTNWFDFLMAQTGFQFPFKGKVERSFLSKFCDLKLKVEISFKWAQTFF